MPEVPKGASRNTKNENKRDQIFQKVLHMNLEYVSGKKKHKEENKTKQTKRKQNKNQ